MFKVLPSCDAVTPKSLPENCSSRMRPVMLCFKRICTPNFFALASSGRMSAVPFPPVGEYALTSPVQTTAWASFSFFRPPVLSPGRFFWELDAVCQQKIKCRHAFVAEGAHNFSVTEPVIVPMHQVLEHAVRRIFNPVFFLQARAAAQSDVAAALDG